MTDAGYWFTFGPTLDAGYKIVYMTDRKTYRAEIHQYDVMLTAKQD